MNEFIPLVSVIIPNYNNAKYITQCIESVESQTYKQIEIIIVDDCSTDNSREIIAELAAKYNNIVPINLEKNGGVSNARNVGAKNSTGEYICFLDPDDFFWADDKIQNEMNLINEHLKTGEKIIAYSGVICVSEAGKYVEDRGIEGQLTGYISIPYIARYKDDKHPRNEIVDRDAFFQSGGFDSKMSFWEDSDQFIRMLKLRPIYFTGAFGTAYRYKASGLSHSGIDNEKALKNLEKKYYSDLRPYEKIVFHYYKIMRRLYLIRKKTVPSLLHKGSIIKHLIMGK